MLADVVDHLTCPLCRGDLLLSGRSLRCPAGHAFDVARQGYVNLLPGGARAGTADTQDMVRDRAAFLGAGHFDPLARRLSALVPAGSACVLDAGAGTGHYLRAVLTDVPAATGIALDISKFALRRAASAHPRIGAAVWDLWQPLPVRSGSIDAIINVFAPRNAAEFRRVLRPAGRLLVVTPARGHLGALVEGLALLSVDAHKQERLAAVLRGQFELVREEDLEIPLSLDQTEVRTLVGMGPNAWHLTGEYEARLAALPTPLKVVASFRLSVFRPAAQPPAQRPT